MTDEQMHAWLEQTAREQEFMADDFASMNEPGRRSAKLCADRAANLRAVSVRLQVLRAKLYECPDCGFAFAAEHVNDDGTNTHSCPCCAQYRLEDELIALRATTPVAEGARHE